jgi:hypothetical protein
MSVLTAVIVGSIFGFVLQRIGASDPDKIIDMLRLRDLHLMKTILLGIGVASTGLFIGLYLGLIDVGHVSVKAMYPGVVLGGLLLGFGWAIAGYCPGTGVVAAGSGRKDGWFFILGGLFGAGLFTALFGLIKDSWLFEPLLGGKGTLAAPGGVTGVVSGLAGTGMAIVIAFAFVFIANALPEREKMVKPQ